MSTKSYSRAPKCVFCGEVLKQDFEVTVDYDGQILMCCGKCFHKAELLVRGKLPNKEVEHERT
jgi:hypothetical protein